MIKNIKYIIIYIYIVIIWINNLFYLPILLINYFISDTNNNKYILSITNILMGILKLYVNIHVENKNILNNIDSSVIISNHYYAFIPSIINISNHKPKKLRTITIIHVWYHVFFTQPYLFLSNSIILDQNKLKNIDENIYKINNNENIYLCPEGAHYCEENLSKSNKWCDDNNLPRMKNCLYPRVGAMKMLNKVNNLKSIYTVLVNYNNEIPSENIDKYNGLSSIKDVYMKIDKKAIGDDIAKTTVDIFYDFDKQLDKPLDTTKYELLPITKDEIKSIICHTLLFIIAIYLLYTNTTVRKYLLVIFILTFLIITIDVYFI